MNLPSPLRFTTTMRRKEEDGWTLATMTWWHHQNSKAFYAPKLATTRRKRRRRKCWSWSGNEWIMKVREVFQMGSSVTPTTPVHLNQYFLASKRIGKPLVPWKLKKRVEKVDMVAGGVRWKWLVKLLKQQRRLCKSKVELIGFITTTHKLCSLSLMTYEPKRTLCTSVLQN